MNMSHGHSRKGRWTKEYRTWASIKARVLNSRSPAFRYYGGRGITICESWAKDFSNFYKDMGLCPIGFTIDRIDNNGPYCKANCRWASRKTQANNRRTNTLLELNGETKSLAEWASKININENTLKTRIRRGWAATTALTTPVRFVRAAVLGGGTP